jgi:hypothetical protein
VTDLQNPLECIDQEHKKLFPEAKRLYDQEKRLDTIMYKNGDGTETAYLFDEPVKYFKDNGEAYDKSNKLYDVSDFRDDMLEYAYVSNDNDIKTYYPFMLSEENGVVVEANKTLIEISPLIDEESKVCKIESNIEYKDVFNGKASLKYMPTFSGYKEELVLNEYFGNIFSFSIESSELSPIMEANGAISLINENGELFATINPLFVYDSSDQSNITLDNYYELVKNEDDKYIINIVVDDDFLTDTETVYPVIIDPTITINSTGSGASKTILDTPIYNGSGVAYLTAGANPTAVLGYVSGTYGSGRLLMRFPGLAEQPFWNGYYTINSATITLNECSGLYDTSAIGVYNYTGESWDENSTYSSSRWNGVGSFISSQSYSYPNNTVKSFDITSAVNNWISNNNAFNKGVIFKNNTNENNINLRKILYNTEGAIKPYLTVNYQTSQPIANGVYYIKNLNSGKYLQVKNAGTDNGSQIVQYSYHGDKYQRFKVNYETDGYYSLRPMHIENQTSTIDMQNNASANIDGTDCQLYTYESYYQEQKFLIRSAVGGGYQIGTKASEGSKVLEVTNSSLIDNEVVQIWTYSDVRTNDNWVFEKVNFGSAPSYSEIEIGEVRPPNCGGFALRLTGPVSDLQLCLPSWSSVEQCATQTKVIFDGLNLGRQIRIVNNYNTPTFDIADNEYRVAIRVRTLNSGYNNWDYHYMIQLDDGSWAHKQGGYESEELHYINPSSTEPWAAGYDSNVLYFAVTY